MFNKKNRPETDWPRAGEVWEVGWNSGLSPRLLEARQLKTDSTEGEVAVRQLWLGRRLPRLFALSARAGDSPASPPRYTGIWGKGSEEVMPPRPGSLAWLGRQASRWSGGCLWPLPRSGSSDATGRRSRVRATCTQLPLLSESRAATAPRPSRSARRRR